MLSPRDLGWIAGIVEGEGSLGLDRGSAKARRESKYNGSPFLKVAMTDRDVMERRRDSMGVPRLRESQPRYPRAKLVYVLALHGAAAIEWMLTLYALLGERRRAKVRSVIQIWRRHRGAPGARTTCPAGHPLSGTNLFIYRLRNGRQQRQCRQCRAVTVARSAARNRQSRNAQARARSWRRKQAIAREMGQRTLF